jgi:hypothetical protein
LSFPVHIKHCRSPWACRPNCWSDEVSLRIYQLGIDLSLMHLCAVALICSEMATEGVVTYDSGLKQNVLVISVVLCFQGDSPMDAEITSTPVPGVAVRVESLYWTSHRGWEGQRLKPDVSRTWVGMLLHALDGGEKISL